jgi:hypothetical protein
MLKIPYEVVKRRKNKNIKLNLNLTELNFDPTELNFNLIRLN